MRGSFPKLGHIQAASGIVFALFLSLHLLLTTMSAVFGIDAYDRTLGSLRNLYRPHIAVELALIGGSSVIHGVRCMAVCPAQKSCPSNRTVVAAGASAVRLLSADRDLGTRSGDRIAPFVDRSDGDWGCGLFPFWRMQRCGHRGFSGRTISCSGCADRSIWDLGCIYRRKILRLRSGVSSSGPSRLRLRQRLCLVCLCSVACWEFCCAPHRRRRSVFRNFARFHSAFCDDQTATTPAQTSVIGNPDQAVLSASLEQERGFLRAVAYRITGTLADADDVVQEAFIRTLASPPPLLSATLRPWLLRVATNLAIDVLRRRKRRMYVGPWLPAPFPDQPVETESAACRYSARESVTFAFLVALEALTPKQRAVLVLRDVLDLDVRETATVLQLSETNVKVLHLRARQRLSSYDSARTDTSDASCQKVNELLQKLLFALALPMSRK